MTYELPTGEIPPLPMPPLPGPIYRSNSLSSRMTSGVQAASTTSPIPSSMPHGLAADPAENLTPKSQAITAQASGAILAFPLRSSMSPSRSSWPLLLTSSKAKDNDKCQSLEFPNGDRYTGEWQENMPHGRGKYAWAEGRIYDGEWVKGEKHGMGLLVAPSGDRYKGEWRRGHMHGVGSFWGSDGSFYTGNWAQGVKHGLGKKTFPNGDVYQGMWSHGAAQGPGSYEWANGNKYFGEWHEGTMHGFGKFSWASGEWYEGEWEDGYEHGKGKFVSAQGSVYEGTWSQGLRDGKGMFYPPWSDEDLDRLVEGDEEEEQEEEEEEDKTGAAAAAASAAGVSVHSGLGAADDGADAIPPVERSVSARPAGGEGGEFEYQRSATAVGMEGRRDSAGWEAMLNVHGVSKQLTFPGSSAVAKDSKPKVLKRKLQRQLTEAALALEKSLGQDATQYLGGKEVPAPPDTVSQMDADALLSKSADRALDQDAVHYLHLQEPTSLSLQSTSGSSEGTSVKEQVRDSLARLNGVNQGALPLVASPKPHTSGSMPGSGPDSGSWQVDSKCSSSWGIVDAGGQQAPPESSPSRLPWIVSRGGPTRPEQKRDAVVENGLRESSTVSLGLRDSQQSQSSERMTWMDMSEVNVGDVPLLKETSADAQVEGVQVLPIQDALRRRKVSRRQISKDDIAIGAVLERQPSSEIDGEEPLTSGHGRRNCRIGQVLDDTAVGLSSDRTGGAELEEEGEGGSTPQRSSRGPMSQLAGVEEERAREGRRTAGSHVRVVDVDRRTRMPNTWKVWKQEATVRRRRVALWVPLTSSQGDTQGPAPKSTAQVSPAVEASADSSTAASVVVCPELSEGFAAAGQAATSSVMGSRQSTEGVPLVAVERSGASSNKGLGRGSLSRVFTMGPVPGRGQSCDFGQAVPSMKEEGNAEDEEAQGEEGVRGHDLQGARAFAGPKFAFGGTQPIKRPRVDAVMVREYVQGILVSEFPRDDRTAIPKWRGPVNREGKKAGELIYKGHRSYDLMLTLQLGLRYSIGRITPEHPRERNRALDFTAHPTSVRFPPDGTSTTPPHSMPPFKWRDYCPIAFKELRAMFGIAPQDYMLSLCGDDALRELSSPGKSGSVFYLSHDDRFIIKTMRHQEVQVLLRMLPAYYKHVQTQEHTLITKFFGLHSLKIYKGTKNRESVIRFVVMGNLLQSGQRMHRRFDLKGSSQGRSTDKVAIDETTTLKDLDLDLAFHLHGHWRDTLVRQIRADSAFLQQQRIMDYSLLLGVHFKATNPPPPIVKIAERSLDTPAAVPSFGASGIQEARREGMALPTSRSESVLNSMNSDTDMRSQGGAFCPSPMVKERESSTRSFFRSFGSPWQRRSHSGGFGTGSSTPPVQPCAGDPQVFAPSLNQVESDPLLKAHGGTREMVKQATPGAESTSSGWQSSMFLHSGGTLTPSSNSGSMSAPSLSRNASTRSAPAPAQSPSAPRQYVGGAQCTERGSGSGQMQPSNLGSPFSGLLVPKNNVSVGRAGNQAAAERAQTLQGTGSADFHGAMDHRLGQSMTATAVRLDKRTRREITDPELREAYEVILFFGIIDILQEYDVTKKVEHLYKSIQYDGSSISAVNPWLYARRFQSFIFSTFPSENSQQNRAELISLDSDPLQPLMRVTSATADCGDSRHRVYHSGPLPPLPVPHNTRHRS